MDVLEAATSVPARRLGLELGEIRDGYLADLVVWTWRIYLWSLLMTTGLDISRVYSAELKQ